jgi:hypothetical protein
MSQDQPEQHSEEKKYMGRLCELYANVMHFLEKMGNLGF